MGRAPKIILTPEQTDRREIGYYSTPNFVSTFIANEILKIRPEAKTVLDPCIGRGEFTIPFKKKGCLITGYDIVNLTPEGCDKFYNYDFLEVAMEHDPRSLLKKDPFTTDIIVFNPPYNCHEVDYIRKNKVKLTERFGKSATLNMYSLFMRAVIDVAPNRTLIGIVTHDSFLTASGHRELREFILDNCIIHNLHLCPTNLFLDQQADVRTCVMIIERTTKPSYKTKISNRPKNTEEFKKILMNNKFETVHKEKLFLSGLKDSKEFVIGVPEEVLLLFNGRRIADIAACITGISTGNDKIYLSSNKRPGFNMPFYKNPASRRFYSEPDAFLCDDWEEVSSTVSNFIVRNKNLILNGGLSCSSMGVKFGATIRPPGTVFGVNPNIIVDDTNKWWLLSFLNSRLCLFLTRAILIRSNMITSGYASRIPVPNFDANTTIILEQLGKKGHDLVREGNSIDIFKQQIDDVIESFLNFSATTVQLLSDFEKDPTRLT